MPDLMKNKKSVLKLMEHLHGVEISDSDSENCFECKLLQRECNIFASVPFMINQLKHIEESIDRAFSCPSKRAMIRRLQNDGKWNAQCPDPSFKISRDAKKHFVKWFYFLTYSNFLRCIQINEILEKRMVPLITFCAFVARVQSSMIIDREHLFSIFSPRHIKLDHQKEGLKIHGLSDKRFMNCPRVLKDIKKAPFKFKFLPTPFDTTLASLNTIQPAQVIKSQKKKKKILKNKNSSDSLLN